MWHLDAGKEIKKFRLPITTFFYKRELIGNLFNDRNEIRTCNENLDRVSLTI